MPHEPKKIPVRVIVMGLGVLFTGLVALFLVMPAFFDIHVSDALFDTPQQPWMLPPEQQQKYQFSVLEMQGKYQFEQYCVSCHGPFANGQGKASASMGGKVPHLLEANVTLVNGVSAEGFLKTINEGIPGSGMPAFPHIAQHAKESIVAFLLYAVKNREQLNH